ncbi:MAG: TfoX/Sxy family DNA transformation protein [Deinococcales bacterium]
MSMFGRFELGRLIAAVLLGFYSIALITSREAVMQSWLHNVGLAIHEGGHYFVFALAPEFLMILGGSLTQCLMPMLFVFQFWRTRQQFATFATLFWVGYNLLDTAIYIADARARQLPLLFGENSIHDWHYILSALNMLPLDGFFAAITWVLGSLCMVVSALGCVWFAQGDHVALPWHAPKTPETTPISSVLNLGAKSAALLAQIGIHTQADLDRYGALEAYQELIKLELTKPSRSLLLALYGAVTNQEWQKINCVDKEKLLKKAGLLE